jgi:hypothetical protein
MIAIDAGTEIDFSDEHSSNALSPIRTRLESDSKPNVCSDLQEQKQDLERIPTEAGRQIDFRDEQDVNA